MSPLCGKSLRSASRFGLLLLLAVPLFCLPICAQSCGGGGTCEPVGSPPESVGCSWYWDTSTCCWAADCADSPIIIDTTGTGFHLTSAANGVLFDMAGDGHPIKIAWTQPGSGNAFLCLPDSEGRCDNGKDLFGNFTPQPPSPHPNGFLALAEYDKPENGGNGDGIIDSRDAVFSKLRLWIDENHDGISQPNELHTLPELGVYSLSLKYTVSWYTDQYGNHFRYRGIVNPNSKDGTSKDGRFDYDVFLEISGVGAYVPLRPSTDGPSQNASSTPIGSTLAASPGSFRAVAQPAKTSSCAHSTDLRGRFVTGPDSARETVTSLHEKGNLP